MSSDWSEPINIGSDRMITINELAQLIGQIVNKPVTINNIPGPVGVMGRSSDNKLIQQVLGWQPPDNLESGLEKLYRWIELQHCKI
jgi:nucleoside-diphosphate-sugar epimerase